MDYSEKEQGDSFKKKYGPLAFENAHGPFEKEHGILKKEHEVFEKGARSF